MARSVRVLAFAFCLIFLLSCGAKTRTQKVGAPTKPKPVVEEPQILKPEKKIKAKIPPYLGYNPIGKRDPFQPYIEETRPKVVLTPLQTFDIEQLKLVAIIWDLLEPRAMVEDPSGRGYILKKGTLIGKNWGRVTKIKKEIVIVSEQYRDLSGQLVVNEVVIELHGKED